MTDPVHVVTSGIDCVDGEQRRWGLAYWFVETDAGRAASRRPRQKKDCTVRALAKAADMAYDDAYDVLKDRGRRSHRGARFRDMIRDPVDSWSFRWESFPAIRGQKRMNVATFCAERPRGRYVVRTAGHVFAVVDGVAYDTAPERPDRCVYGAWRVVPAQEG